MRKRIFKTIFASSIFILLLSLALFVSFLHSYFDRQVFEELASEANYIARGLEGLGLDYFDGLTSENRITYISADGQVLFDSAADSSAMENHAAREEVQSALRTGWGQSSRRSKTLSENTLYYALRTSDGNVLRVASRQSTILALGLSLTLPILSTVAAAVILCSLLSRRLAGRITAPILALDLAHPEECDTYEELSPLLVRLHKQNSTIRAQMDELRRNQAEFTAITENMSEGFLLIDCRTNLLSYNTSALRLLGASTAVTGQSVLALERGESFRKVVDEALSGRHSEALLRQDGRCYQLYANCVKRSDQIVGAVVGIFDVTDREEREVLRREFTANVTHELKTPLTSISGFAEIMMNRLVPAENVPEFAGDIYKEAQRLITLVDDILHLSELDEDAPMPREEIDLHALCRDVLNRLAPAASKNDITLELTGDEAAVSGSPRVVDEIIYNICENAIKYNRPHGSVTANIRRTEDGVHLSIADTGIGISAAERDRVFERFYRVDKSHSKEIGGTGLGLSIVKHGCAAQGIDLTLNSEPGQGTTITLFWPCRNSL